MLLAVKNSVCFNLKYTKKEKKEKNEIYEKPNKQTHSQDKIQKK